VQDSDTAGRSRHDSGLSTPATFLLALLALGGVVAGLHFLPAQSGSPAYADGVTPTAEPTPNLAAVPDPPAPPFSEDSELSAADVRYVQNWTYYYLNQERIRRGMDPLVRHPGLDQVARNRSYDMSVRGYFSHVDPDGGLAIENEFQDAEIEDCSIYAENIGIYTLESENQRGEKPKTKKQLPRHIIRGFMYSTPHRETILASDQQSIGLGVFADGQAVYVSMVFCSAERLQGSLHYDRVVTPAIKHPSWLPANTEKDPPYTYYDNGYEKAIRPDYLTKIETLTPFPNATQSPS
jgi:uncharacterized protein YkwD